MRKGRTSIQSNFAVSKVHINPQLNEVLASRESLEDGGSASSRISHVSSNIAVSAVGELSQPNAQVMKIEDVVKCSEEYKPWIAASIIGVNNGRHDWCYPACSMGGKKVECAPMGRYECTNEKCGHIGKKPLSK
ncbi:hypothetical protein PIB30_031156 [Stylosanthes scabra]|uniref:Uncharacterized protein n=1 Tax=Stylosanthes scabra TaxID=79078 RepID=A0ABU6Z8M0_9FABA|nr:hypothetical protein [Stylosanthes scabra]